VENRFPLFRIMLWRRASSGKPGIDANGWIWNIGGTQADFQRSPQAINGLLEVGFRRRDALAGANKKAGARPAFSEFRNLDRDQYFATTGPPKR
jgi:hypothetical protein